MSKVWLLKLWHQWISNRMGSSSSIMTVYLEYLILLEIKDTSYIESLSFGYGKARFGKSEHVRNSYSTFHAVMDSIQLQPTRRSIFIRVGVTLLKSSFDNPTSSQPIFCLSPVWNPTYTVEQLEIIGRIHNPFPRHPDPKR